MPPLVRNPAGNGTRHALLASKGYQRARRSKPEGTVMNWMSIVLAISLVGLSFQSPERSQKPDSPPDAKGQGSAENYYLVVFAAQSEPPVARRSHTFACFVKAGGRPEERKILESLAISWLPKSLNVAVVRALPEEGVNLALLPTLKWARGLDAQVSAWGPFSIKKELYDRAATQKSHLESGAVSYKAVDLKAPIQPPAKPALKAPLKTALKGVLQREEHLNCIHAVSDIAGSDLATGTAHGVAASGLVVRHLQAWMINPEETHPWLIEALGLKEQPIRFQK